MFIFFLETVAIALAFSFVADFLTDAADFLIGLFS
jgi:hypothetical protein